MSTKKETKKTKYLHIRISEKLLKQIKAKDINISGTVRSLLEAEVTKK